MVHVVELIAAMAIILCIVDGWRKGLVLKLFGLVRFILIIVLTVVLTPFIYTVMPLEPGMREGISVLAALVLSIVLLLVVSKVLHIIDKIPVLNTINRLAGALIGLVFGALAVWLAIVLISSFDGISWCKTISGYVKESVVLSYLAHLNPMDLLK